MVSKISCRHCVGFGCSKIVVLVYCIYILDFSVLMTLFSAWGVTKVQFTIIHLHTDSLFLFQWAQIGYYLHKNQLQMTTQKKLRIWIHFSRCGSGQLVTRVHFKPVWSADYPIMLYFWPYLIEFLKWLTHLWLL